MQSVLFSLHFFMCHIYFYLCLLVFACAWGKKDRRIHIHAELLQTKDKLIVSHKASVFQVKLLKTEAQGLAGLLTAFGLLSDLEENKVCCFVWLYACACAFLCALYALCFLCVLYRTFSQSTHCTCRRNWGVTAFPAPSSVTPQGPDREAMKRLSS